MLWSAFKALVRTHMPAHGRRAGIQSMIDQLILSGVEDIQRACEFYQAGHVNIYGAGDLSVDGFASTGPLPAGQIIRARIVKYDTVAGELLPAIYLGLSQAPWSAYANMRDGELAACIGLIAIDPVTRRFGFVPGLNVESRLVFEWSGVKSDFNDADPVPFDNLVAMAVADFVLARVVRQVDRDLGMAQSYQGSFIGAKRHIISDALDRVRLKEMDGSSNLSGSEDLTSGVFPTTPLGATFTFMPTIVSILGADATSLQGITSSGLATGVVYLFIIGDDVQYWRLAVGSQATDVNAGYVRPVDYTTRVWIRIQ